MSNKKLMVTEEFKANVKIETRALAAVVLKILNGVAELPIKASEKPWDAVVDDFIKSFTTEELIQGFQAIDILSGYSVAMKHAALMRDDLRETNEKIRVEKARAREIADEHKLMNADLHRTVELG